ncbi:MAG: hypothetical protein IPI11_13470 [Haliscomenobacter sp.]|nr:hypothetical protein [Haliscomenobacter sp.]
MLIHFSETIRNVQSPLQTLRDTLLPVDEWGDNHKFLGNGKKTKEIVFYKRGAFDEIKRINALCSSDFQN